MSIDWAEFRADRDAMTPDAFARKYLPAGVPPWACEMFETVPDGEWQSDSGVQLVPTAQIVGTTNVQYGGRAWLHVLQSLKRPENLFKALEDPVAFAEHLRSERTGIDLRRFGDLYYVGGEGNHRCVIARFLCVPSLRASVAIYSPRV